MVAVAVTAVRLRGGSGVFRGQLRAAGDQPCVSVLELGSGGGNNASFMKAQFELALVEPALGMLAVSRALNPDCEHVEGDIRTIRLGRQFDRVFIHDAICYMATEADPRCAMPMAASTSNTTATSRVCFHARRGCGYVTDVGFEARIVPLDHSELEPNSHEIFIGERSA